MDGIRPCAALRCGNDKGGLLHRTTPGLPKFRRQGRLTTLTNRLGASMARMLQVNLALWGMLICAEIKLAELIF
jgi:hypothetical protein